MGRRSLPRPLTQSFKWVSLAVPSLPLLVLLLLTPVPAQASTGPALSLGPTAGPPTTTVTATGTGFVPDESVRLTAAGRLLGTLTANGAGAFRCSGTIPASAKPGSYVLTATGSTGDQARATFTVRTDWTMFEFDPARDGTNPYENVLGPANVGSLQVAWSIPPGTQGGWGAPAVSAGVVYVMRADDTVFALNEQTGQIIWQTNLANPFGSESAPTVANGVVYVGDVLGLYALDAATGTRIWSYPISAWHSPAVVGGIVYSGSAGQGVLAVNAATGKKVWQASPSGSAGVFGNPAVAGGLVYAGDETGLYAFDAATGAEVWKAGSYYADTAGPTVANGLVFGAESNCSAPCYLAAVDATTGALRWSFKAPKGLMFRGGFAVANGVLYAETTDSEVAGQPPTPVYAFDAATGGVLWNAPVAGVGALGGVAVANGIVYAGGSDPTSDLSTISGLDAATGSLLWQYDGAVRSFFSAPAIVDGKVIAGDIDGGGMYAFALPGS